MEQIPDDPIIRNCERTGYPDGKEPVSPICPVCGRECETVFKDISGEIVGCDECLDPITAWDEPKCFPGKDGDT